MVLLNQITLQFTLHLCNCNNILHRLTTSSFARLTRYYLQARSLQSNRLELHFRPEDPYSHPAFGDLRPCNHLLLKLSRIKSSNGQDAQVSGTSALQNGNNLDYTYTTRASESASGSTSSAKQVDVQIPEDDQTNLCADIVARVLEAYHFDG